MAPRARTPPPARRVSLVVTGACEQRALAASLARLFPDAAFDVALRDGFTSARLGVAPLLGGPVRSNLEKLAAEVVARVEPGMRGEPAEAVFVIDDLELCNADQPERVVAHFRAAVAAHLERAPFATEKSRAVAAERVRARCSLHLLAPMLEAYFFGEAAALSRAGAVAGRPIGLGPGGLERFAATDAGYLGRAPDRDVSWACAAAERAGHPKHYLQYLCDPDTAGTPGGFFYRETRGGVAALQALDWPQVLAGAVPFAHALVADLADVLSVPCPASGTPHPLTAPGKHDVLRNA